MWVSAFTPFRPGAGPDPGRPGNQDPDEDVEIGSRGAGPPSAQLAVQDLARHGLRQLVHELDRARVLVGRHAFLAERDEVGLAGLLTGTQADERLDRLAPVLV